MLFRVVAKTVEPREFRGPNGETRPYTVRRATCIDETGLPWFLGWPEPAAGRAASPLESAQVGDEVELALLAVESDKGAIRGRVQ